MRRSGCTTRSTTRRTGDLIGIETETLLNVNILLAHIMDVIFMESCIIFVSDWCDTKSS